MVVLNTPLIEQIWPSVQLTRVDFISGKVDTVADFWKHWRALLFLNIKLIISRIENDKKLQYVGDISNVFLDTESKWVW